MDVFGFLTFLILLFILIYPNFWLWLQANVITTGVEKKKTNAATSISEVRILKVHNSSFCVLTHGAKPLTTNIRSYIASFWDVCLSVLEQRRNSIESGELDVDLLLFGVFCYKKPNLQTNLLSIHLANNSTAVWRAFKTEKIIWILGVREVLYYFGVLWSRGFSYLSELTFNSTLTISRQFQASIVLLIIIVPVAWSSLSSCQKLMSFLGVAQV